jgi:hypothetical protein
MNTITLNNDRAIRQDAQGRLEVQHHGEAWAVIGSDSFEFFALNMFRRLLELSWIPIIERLPTREDANDFADVEWSDGKQVWEGTFNELHDTATHWKRIVLP